MDSSNAEDKYEPPDDVVVLLGSGRSDGRAYITRHAAVIERLREQLPGWASRRIVHPKHERCHWPVAVVRFRLPAAHEDLATSRRIAASAVDRHDDLVACVWQVGDRTSPSPQVVMAAQLDDKGFKPRELDTAGEERVRLVVQRALGAPLRPVSELTLPSENELRAKLKARVNLARVQFQRLGFPFPAGNKIPRAAMVIRDRLLLRIDRGQSSADLGGRSEYQALRSLILLHQPHVAGRLPELSTGTFERIEVHRRETPFYQGYALYRVSVTAAFANDVEVNKQEQTGFVVAPDWHLLRPSHEEARTGERLSPRPPIAILVGQSPPIHNLNKLLGEKRQINAETALDYLQFFCEFVHASEGAFFVLETTDDLRWSSDHPVNESRRKLVAEAVLPIQKAVADEANKQEGFRFVATVLYGGDLFLAAFVVRRDGMVEMVEDQILLARLPVRPYKFGPEHALFSAPVKPEASES